MLKITDHLHPTMDAPISDEDFGNSLDELSAPIGLRASTELAQRAIDCSMVPLDEDHSASISRIASIRLPEMRDQIIRQYHKLVRSRHDNGGLVCGFYRFRLFREPKPIESLLLNGIGWAGGERILPLEIRGCSDHTIASGEYSKIEPSVFAEHALEWLASGGAYAKPLPVEKCIERTEDYLRALAGPPGFDQLDCYWLKPTFSLWFFDVAWDAAYFLINRSESWFAIIAITDTD